MHRSRFLSLIGIVACSPLLWAQGSDPTPVVIPDLSKAEVRQHWTAYVLPGAKEQAWLKLGWGSQLHAALEKARKAERPVLFWAMNGHPLGCV